MIVGNRNKVLISTPNGKNLNNYDQSPASNSDDGSEEDSSKKNGSKPKGKTSEYEEKIRVGKDFQAVCPEMASEKRLEMVGNDRALLVWSPTKDIPDTKLEEYISVAKEKYGYNGEQALGMLFWHKHDLERAVLDLANFTPFPDEWTVEDKVLFEQAFQFHGKSFHRIRQMLPDKTIASLVKYYYSWKKTRSRTSVMDRHEKKKIEGGSENGSENGSNENDSENEEKKCWHRGIRRASRSPNNSKNSIPNITNSNDNSNTSFKQTVPTIPNQSQKNGNTSLIAKQDVTKDGQNENNKDTGYSSSSSSTSGQQPSANCTNCNVLCNELKASTAGSFCFSCHHHWRRTGDLRPTSGPNFLGNKANKRPHSKTGQLYYYHGYHDGSSKTKCKPPRGMYINHDDVVQLATQSKLQCKTTLPSSNNENRPNDLLASMDREIVSLWSHIQKNKQKISGLKRENIDHVEDKEAKDQYNLYNRINTRWAPDELLLAVKGVRKYGKNWQAIAEMLGTKTDSQVRQYFASYRRQYNLDKVLKEYEAETADDTNKSDINIVLKIDLEEETNGMNGTEDISNIDEIIGVSKGRSTQSGRSNLDRSVIYVDDLDENESAEKMDVTEESDEPTLKRYSITEPIQTEGARVARETKAGNVGKSAVSAKVAITAVSKDAVDVEMEEVPIKKVEEPKAAEVTPEVTTLSLPSTPVTATTVPITT